MSDEESKKRNWNPGDVEKFVEEIEEELDLIAEFNAQNAEKVAVVKGRIAGAYKRAKALGILKKPLKAIIEDRKAERKRKERIEALEEDEQETFYEFQKALGTYSDTPLGQAALARKEERDAQKSATIDALVSEKNSEILQEIKQL